MVRSRSAVQIRSGAQISEGTGTAPCLPASGGVRSRSPRLRLFTNKWRGRWLTVFKQKKVFLVVLIVIGIAVVAWKTEFLGKNLELLSKRSSQAPLEELLQTAPTPPNTATFISPLKDARIALIAN